MADDPEVDGRDSADILDHATAIAPNYVEEWDPESDDGGRALVKLFSEIAGDVVERLDRVPAKHRVAFFDRLGFSSRPPQPARLPLVFTIADGAEGSVTVPGGTQVVAPAAGGRPEKTFETATDAGFEATPATLTEVLSVDPKHDEIYEHGDDLDAGTGTRLFRKRDPDEDRQAHVLYVGHAEQLAVEGAGGDDPKTVRVDVETAAAAALADGLVWEYYGTETTDGPEDWHEFEAVSVGPDVVWLHEPAVDGGFDAIGAHLDDHGFPSPTGGSGTDAVQVVDPDPASVRGLVSALRADPDLPDGVTDGLFQRTTRLALDFGGAFVETPVDGTKSRWLRCRLPDGYDGSSLFEVVVGSTRPEGARHHPTVRVGPDPTGGTMAPDALLSNDVELPVDGDAIRPLGRLPRPQDAFYVASAEALTKVGATVELRFEPPPADDGDGTPPSEIDAEIAWEYWDGSAWSRLDVIADGTAALTKPDPGGGAASVRFVVPADLEPTAALGHDGHWVRARLVGGDYGELSATEDSGEWTTTRNVDPPRVGGVTVEYAEGGLVKPARQLLARNNLAFGDDLTGRDRFRPFVHAPEDGQSLYLGFDGPLDDGPVNLLFSMVESGYPEWFYSRLRWEYWNPATESWARLQVRDGTEGLTERGIVGLVFPERTVPVERFGRTCHWIRARVAGARFGDPDGDAAGEGQQGDGGKSGDGGTGPTDDPEPCGETLATGTPGGVPKNTLPVLRAVHPNAVWAENVRRVEAEVLGSSDGTQDQSFSVSAPPVTAAEVWVDELQVLSAGQREALREAQPDGVEAETGPRGEQSRFWVRWERVPDLLNSGGDERHYTLDRASGLVRFGDGRLGRIPPRGVDNVRASYETGGGADGNVEAGAVGGLKSAIPFVDSVTNPEAADGGADEESTDEVLERAPRELRDRGRAVTEADFERIATDASRRLARAKCISGMDRAGDHAPGWVTLLVVPSAPRRKPVPSVTLEAQVREAVSERAPATLVADPDQLVVRGPSYVSVAVETELVATGTGSVATVEETAAEAVASFLHPLTGGPDGDGWPFGELPSLSDCYALLEGVEGVDHVVDLSMRFSGKETAVTVHEGESLPNVSRDALVHSGDHEIRAGIARREPATEGGS